MLIWDQLLVLLTTHNKVRIPAVIAAEHLQLYWIWILLIMLLEIPTYGLTQAVTIITLAYTAMLGIAVKQAALWCSTDLQVAKLLPMLPRGTIAQ